ncbi:hypothetical protein AB0I81_17725 [Nonomuraea sp. NPDC050404]
MVQQQLLQLQHVQHLRHQQLELWQHMCLQHLGFVVVQLILTSGQP